MNEETGVSAGRGRGRGRGGVPLLPAGLWQSTIAEPSAPEVHIQSIPHARDFNEDVSKYEDAAPPNGFASKNNKFTSGSHGGFGSKKGGIPDPSVDWTCVSCGNVNWARRSTCNMCNANKPKSALTEDEERTGAGGGFNERQERAAATTIEVAEDGFDDFGRRATGKKADRKAKEAAALLRLHGAFGIVAPSEEVNITNAHSLAFAVPDAAEKGDMLSYVEEAKQRREDRAVDVVEGAALSESRKRSRSPMSDRRSGVSEKTESREPHRRDRDRDRDRHREVDRVREDERERDRERGVDSRRGDDRRTSEREKERTSERDKGERDKEHTSVRDKERTSERNKEHTSVRDKERTSVRDKEHTSVRDKERTSERDRDRDSRRDSDRRGRDYEDGRHGRR